jgi:hypothetical protein
MRVYCGRHKSVSNKITKKNVDLFKKKIPQTREVYEYYNN